MNSKSIDAAIQTKAVKATLLVDASCAKRGLDVGFTTFYKLVKLGYLTPIRFSKRLVRYRVSEIEALIDATAKNGGVL
jgi:predicted DNA-binding transcriptional regulator AlpA